MKLIELLNKIANGEVKEGTKFRFIYSTPFDEIETIREERVYCVGDGNLVVNVDNLEEEVEIIEEKQQGRWKPKKGERYWFIDSYKEIFRCTWSDAKLNNWRYTTKNVFKTKQEAEEYLEYKTALLEAEEPFVYGEFNFAIECDASVKKPYLGWNTRVMSQGQIYLGQHKDVAQAFVDKWHKQILKYEFGIEE